MTAERHAIFCPAHAVPARTVGDARRCRHGDHSLVRWWVVDVRHQLVLEEVSDDDWRELGQPLATCPRLGLEEVSLTEKERKSMPRGVPGSGPYGDPSKATQPKPARGKACLLSTKLSAGSKVLWLRLLRSASGTDETRYRIRWEQIDAKDPKAGSESGVVAAFGQEEYAREQYAEAVAVATRAGWVASTPARLVLKPIPLPPAGSKGKKAA